MTETELTTELLREIWAAHMKRVEAIRAVGGISAMEVAFGGVSVPMGWVRDVSCYYWVPPHFSMSKH